MAGAALRIRKKSMAPQATTLRPYRVMRKPIGVLKKRQKATSPVAIVCFHVFGVSEVVVEWLKVFTKGFSDLLSTLLDLVVDGEGEMFGNVDARLLSPGAEDSSLVARCPFTSKSMLFFRKSVRFGACAMAVPVADHIPGGPL